MAGIGIAISGGGHRAALFGLGVLMYLTDAGKNRDVVSISSVSGGSITNAFVGLEGDYPAASREDFAASAAKLARQMAIKGTLFAWWGTKVYLVLTVLAGLATVAVWLLPYPSWVRLGLFVLALIVWDLLFVRRRGDICARAYAATCLQGDDNGRPQLAGLADRAVDHIICATHLNAGEHLYLSGRFVTSYRFGTGAPQTYPLDEAVQASTALPGAFPPRWLRTGPFGFTGGAEEVPPAIPLVDGGVYDNMADEWFKGIERRAERIGTDVVRIPSEVVLVNASASNQMMPVGKMRLPLVGELFGLLRDVSIMYDNSASLRKSGLIATFDRGAASGTGMRGCLVDIASSPFTAPDVFASSTEFPERTERATAALQALAGTTREFWRDEARFTSRVKTSLSKLGVADSARILRHAYALAAVNLHVMLGYPLVPIPSLDEFQAICS